MANERKFTPNGVYPAGEEMIGRIVVFSLTRIGNDAMGFTAVLGGCCVKMLINNDLNVEATLVGREEAVLRRVR